MYICGRVCASESMYPNPEEDVGSLELELQVIVYHLTWLLRPEFCPCAWLYSFSTIEPSFLFPKPPILLLILNSYFSVHHYFEEYCHWKCREPKRTRKKQNRLWNCAYSSTCDTVTYSSPSEKKWCKWLRPPHCPWNIKGVTFSTLRIWNHILWFSPMLKQHDAALFACVAVKWEKRSLISYSGSELWLSFGK